MSSLNRHRSEDGRRQQKNFTFLWLFLTTCLNLGKSSNEEIFMACKSLKTSSNRKIRLLPFLNHAGAFPHANPELTPGQSDDWTFFKFWIPHNNPDSWWFFSKFVVNCLISLSDWPRGFFFSFFFYSSKTIFLFWSCQCCHLYSIHEGCHIGGSVWVSHSTLPPDRSVDVF